jgi:cob(I)alamin adenosyltransferase
MVKLNKIYTRTGDDGTTGLADGTRRPKDHERIRTMGSVDETNCALGLVRLQVTDVQLDALLARLQNDLFDLGADLAIPITDTLPQALQGYTPLRIKSMQVKALEDAIDSYNEALAPLTSFILPAGKALSVYLHLARTTCRRAECDMISLSHAELGQVNLHAMHYLNRLSDLLFVLARHANDDGKADVLWVPSPS